MSRNRFKLCLKINNTKCMAKLHAGKRQEVHAVFSDLVLNAQFLEQINDRNDRFFSISLLCLPLMFPHILIYLSTEA